MKLLTCIAVIGCGTPADAGFANDWKAPFEVMKTQIETMYAPVEDYWSESNGVPHGCRPVVHIPDEPPKCFVTHFHGWTSCPDDFGEFLPDLMAAGCLVVVPAWPGHGFKHGGGRPNLPGFRSADFPESSMAPEPEKYFQHIFDVAYILSDAGVGSLPNKMVVGHSLGGPAAAMFALCSDVQWDRVLVMNPAFKMAEPADQILFDLPYSTPLSFTSPIALDIPLVDVSACKDEDKVTSPGYCDFYTSSMVTIFQFGYVVMGFWEAVPLFRQGLGGEANGKIEEMMGHVLEMGGMGGSMRAWDGMDGHLHFAPVAKGHESSWDVREREHPGRQANLTAVLRRKAQYLAESDGTNIQVVGCGEHGRDMAVSKKGIQKFIELAGAGGREIPFCSFPGGLAGMPHPWSRPYTNPGSIFWWTQYVRVALTRFALHGENFQKMDVGSRTKDEPDICFVDQMADGDAENAPFLGLEYTARYTIFETPALMEQWEEFSFTGLKCGSGLGCETHVWKMSQAKGLFGRQEISAVQPLHARFANSSRPSAEPHDWVPILVDRDEPEVWSQVLRRPIRAAWVTAPGGCNHAFFRHSLARTTVLEGSEEGGVCLTVPLRRLMGHGDTAGTLAKSLVAGALYDASGGNAKMHQFCGKSSEVAVLNEHICSASLAMGLPAVV